MMNDTIVAISTPPGRGGVGIVRISGSNAYSIAQQICKKKVITPRNAEFVSLLDSKDKLIDQGIVIFFKSPASFTGEDVIELQVHGSPVVLDAIVATIIKYGARIANPGEFSERAFLNDKIDLAQAEAIADLINANSLTQARMALNSLQGEFSRVIHNVNEKIINLRMYVEACIDFPEEEIDFLSDGKIVNSLKEILIDVTSILKNSKDGAVLREGVKAVIYGKPNRGKSTLINYFAQRDVAIVTDIPGTTRDVIRETVLIDDLAVHLIDTAGIRESTDKVELEGIKRTYNELQTAQIVLFIIDVNDLQNLQQDIENFQKYLDTSIPQIIVLNKIDLLEQEIKLQNFNLPKDLFESIVPVSAKTGVGMDKLKQKIKDLLNFHPQEGQFLARRRHLDALERALAGLNIGLEEINRSKALELLAENLKLAHRALGEITGEFTADDLLGKIFSSFCIGK